LGLALKGRRESIWIIAEILELTSNGATASHIARKLGLNFRTAQRHVDRLLASGHLRQHLTVSSMLHELTEKGELFLAGLIAIRGDVDEVFSLPRPPTVLVEAQASPYYPRRGRTPFRAQSETR